ncbi:MAG TPA: two-component regulator propeller domain-containing protein, partial [Cyclobacteriaceae bacterium]|nr:two-component regulator propeller domain-containing protein [Cyclobacteriaceae bacterium]
MFRYLFLLIICISFAKQASASSDSLFFSTLSIRDGLPSNIINSIAQDKNDFIWIGTSNGLCRYDGHRFITFKREGSNSLPANEISSLLIDGDFIWVGTWKGLCKINTLTFEVVPIDMKGNNIIRTLCKGDENNIWAGTTTGLIKYSKDGLIEYNTSNSNISHNVIRAILPDKFGNLWVGTYDKVNKLPKGQNSFVQVDLKRNYKPELKNNLICDIKPVVGNDSLIWVGTETGLCQVNVFSGSYHQYNEKNVKLSNEVVKNIYTDNKGNLWLGTDFGLNILSLKDFSNKIVFHNPQLPYSIANNVIWQIMEDTGGV